jgi:hypothetical protein
VFFCILRVDRKDKDIKRIWKHFGYETMPWLSVSLAPDFEKRGKKVKNLGEGKFFEDGMEWNIYPEETPNAQKMLNFINVALGTDV